MPRYLQIFLLFVFIGSGSYAQPQGFIQNKGQWQEDFDYQLKLSHGAVFLEGSSYTVNLLDAADLPHHGHEKERHEESDQDKMIDAHSYRVKFVGASEMQPVGLQQSETYFNYFLSNDPGNWQGHVPLFGKVNYPNLYQGIDLQYYFSEDDNLKYDFVLRPGARPDQILLKYTGADELLISSGNLIVKTSVGDVMESAPVAYQIIEGKRYAVACAYILLGNEVRFSIGEYDPSEILIIDPQLVFSTYTGSTLDNWGYTATHSEDGGLYAGGIVFGGTGSYPTTTGAYRLSFSGGDVDVSISKFSADGSSLVYSTYMGGSSSEMPYSLYESVDKTLIIMGSTSSADFPVTATAYDTSFNGGVTRQFGGPIHYLYGADIFVTALDSSGGSLIGSSFFGGAGNDGFNRRLEHNYGDIFRGEVIADNTGNIFGVFSTNSYNLPVGTAAFQSDFRGVQDGFVVSFSPDLSTLRWGTYLGGSRADNALSVKKGLGNDVYVAGGSDGGGMILPGNSYHSQPLGDVDGYILRLSDIDGSYLNGTFNGTPDRDMNFFVDIDNGGDIYVFGQTRGAYPLLGDSLYSNPGSGQFIDKISGDLGASLRSITIGDSSHASSNISPTAFMVDGCRNVFLSGWGGGNNRNAQIGYNQGTTNSLPVTPDAYKDTTDGEDFYFMVLDNTWENLKYATFFGGQSADHVDGGTSRFSEKGVIYQAVCAGCGGGSSFPTTPNVWSPQNQSSNCNLAAVKMEFENNAVEARAVADIKSGCIPYTANLTNLSVNADIYQWKLPDGQLVQGDTSSIEVTTPGMHSFRLIAFDTVCQQVDSMELVLEGIDDSVYAEVATTIDSSCLPRVVTISNLSYGADKYRWIFPDGSSVQHDTTSFPITAEGANVYRLIAMNTACGLVDSTEVVLYGEKNNFQADFSTQFDSCSSTYEVAFQNISIDADDFLWTFGDGDTAYQESPTHKYENPGEYEVKLVSRNTFCDLIDSVKTKVYFHPEGSAGVALDYDPCEDGTTLHFRPYGRGFQQYTWSFPDDFVTTDSAVSYDFAKPGDYRVGLTLRDSICERILEKDTIVSVYSGFPDNFEMPNVFTPNADGVNDFFGLPKDIPVERILDYSLRIYNRWGAEVYVSDNISEPWDGTFNGSKVPESVYFYLVNFSDECGNGREMKGFVHLFKNK